MFILDVWNLNICHTIPSAFLFFDFQVFSYKIHLFWAQSICDSSLWCQWFQDSGLWRYQEPLISQFSDVSSILLSPAMLKLCHFKLLGIQDVAFSRFYDWELEYFMVRISFQKIGRKCSKCSSWFWVLVILVSLFYFNLFLPSYYVYSFRVENAHLK